MTSIADEFPCQHTIECPLSRPMKRKHVLLGLVMTSLVTITAISAYRPARSNPAISPAISVAPVTTPVVSAEPIAPVEDNHEKIDALSKYTYESMKSWATPKTSSDDDRFHSIANDISTVVLDSNEPTIWNSDASRGKAAIYLATLGYWEGFHFAEYVDKGLCNDIKWVATKEGREKTLGANCDGGYAYSIYQIHPEGGIILTQDGWTKRWADRTGHVKFYDGQDLIADRKIATKVALHMVRQSIHMGGNLCGYSGEGATMDEDGKIHYGGGCPKAADRQNFAENWYRKHPFVQ